MDKIDIRNVDLVNSYFHFTKRTNLESIEESGLIAQVGNASQMVGDKPRVCLSRGAKGMLGIINSFIHKFKECRICDIPEGYREYFHILDFSSEETLDEKIVYRALEKKLKQEVYLIVDAQEGIDFESSEIYGISAAYDIKGKENHNIEANKIKQLTSPKGDSTFQIINYLYERLLQKNPTQEKLIKQMLSDLAGMHEYINNHER